MDAEQHEASAAERAALHGPPIPPPAAGPGPAMPAAEHGPDPDPEEPGPCKECAGRGDTMLALVALGVAAVIAIMAVDLLSGGQLSAIVFGRTAGPDGSE